MWFNKFQFLSFEVVGYFWEVRDWFYSRQSIDKVGVYESIIMFFFKMFCKYFYDVFVSKRVMDMNLVIVFCFFGMIKCEVIKFFFQFFFGFYNF